MACPCVPNGGVILCNASFQKLEGIDCTGGQNPKVTLPASAMAASAPPMEIEEDPAVSQTSVAAEQLARLPNASIIAHEASTGATRVEAAGEALLLKAQPEGSPSPVVFLLVGGAFSYPIVLDAVAMVDGNRVLFPTPGQDLSIILQPVNVESALWDAFIDELQGVCTLRNSPAAVEAGEDALATSTSSGWGDTVANGVRTAGAAAAYGLVKGATYTGYGIARYVLSQFAAATFP